MWTFVLQQVTWKVFSFWLGSIGLAVEFSWLIAEGAYGLSDYKSLLRRMKIMFRKPSETQRGEAYSQGSARRGIKYCICWLALTRATDFFKN